MKSSLTKIIIIIIVIRIIKIRWLRRTTTESKSWRMSLPTSVEPVVIPVSHPVLSGCFALANTGYLHIHNQAAKILHRRLALIYGLPEQRCRIISTQRCQYSNATESSSTGTCLSPRTGWYWRTSLKSWWWTRYSRGCF